MIFYHCWFFNVAWVFLSFLDSFTSFKFFFIIVEFLVILIDWSFFFVDQIQEVIETVHNDEVGQFEDVVTDSIKVSGFISGPVKENIEEAFDFFAFVDFGLSSFLVGDFLFLMGKPLAFFPGDLITFNGELLTATNFEVPDDGGFVEVRVFLEDKLEGDVVILIGVLWEDVLNVQQIGKSLFIILSNFTDKRAVGQDWVPIVINNFSLHVVLDIDILIRLDKLLSINQLVFFQRSASDNLRSLELN